MDVLFFVVLIFLDKIKQKEVHLQFHQEYS